jgi:hypothetical protein
MASLIERQFSRESPRKFYTCAHSISGAVLLIVGSFAVRSYLLEGGYGLGGRTENKRPRLHLAGVRAVGGNV